MLKKCIADGGFIVVCCCLRSEDPEEEDEPNDPTLSPETHTGNMEVGPQYRVVITPGESRGGRVKSSLLHDDKTRHWPGAIKLR